MSFRKKIFISYAAIFLFFICLMFPFAGKTVKRIVTRAMEERASELILKIQSATDNESLVRMLKDQKPRIFFRVSVISNERKVLYDSHMKRLLGPKFSQEYVVEHPEVLEAFNSGHGYNEEYSDLLGQKFAYFAKAFDFHGNTYVMRSAFPYKYVEEMTQDFEIGFFTISVIVLLLFSLMALFTFHHLSSPIQKIIDAVRPYQEGAKALPEIQLAASPSDDFGKLAATLNSLSRRVQKHIDSLIQERNEKEAVLESLIEGVISTDQDGRVTYINQTALDMLGLDFRLAVGRHITDLAPVELPKLLLECVEENTLKTTSMQMKNDWGRVYLDLVAAPKKEKQGAVLVLHDNSIHYKLLEMRKDFIANASHELKTPITIIKGFAETLYDHPDLSKDVIADVTQKIVRNCSRMTSLVKDLLALADIENLPRERLTDCNLIEIVSRCDEQLKIVYPEAEVQIAADPQADFHVFADPQLLDLAISNLMENAAKYNEAPISIQVEIKDLGSSVELSVIDNGIGIPEKDLDHIFERFYRVDKARSRKMGGSGLGLSIVQTIVEKHFGKISVSSTVKKGSTFTIQLPKEPLIER